MKRGQSIHYATTAIIIHFWSQLVTSRQGFAQTVTLLPFSIKQYLFIRIVPGSMSVILAMRHCFMQKKKIHSTLLH